MSNGNFKFVQIGMNTRPLLHKNHLNEHPKHNKENNSNFCLTLVLLNPDLSLFENNVDLDQLACANFESHLIRIHTVFL